MPVAPVGAVSPIDIIVPSAYVTPTVDKSASVYTFSYTSAFLILAPLGNGNASKNMQFVNLQFFEFNAPAIAKQLPGLVACVASSSLPYTIQFLAVTTGNELALLLYIKPSKAPAPSPLRPEAM